MMGMTVVGSDAVIGYRDGGTWPWSSVGVEALDYTGTGCDVVEWYEESGPLPPFNEWADWIRKLCDPPSFKLKDSPAPLLLGPMAHKARVAAGRVTVRYWRRAGVSRSGWIGRTGWKKRRGK